MAQAVFPSIDWPTNFINVNVNLSFFANLDVFSLPSVGCIATTNFVDRFLGNSLSVSTLLLIVLIMRSRQKGEKIDRHKKLKEMSDKSGMAAYDQLMAKQIKKEKRRKKMRKLLCCCGSGSQDKHAKASDEALNAMFEGQDLDEGIDIQIDKEKAQAVEAGLPEAQNEPAGLNMQCL